ncbi:unnamed protein product [Meganyctiphanes norvegica]|uniref:Uncharacterized protein n=1 Tax=Meganyctiphanes norvegica TaxID=48144 RepID=A0AAV2Q909_MEGNR
MDSEITPLEKSLMELLEPSTTPEKALQSFSSFSFSQDAYNRNKEHVLICVAHIKFIMTRLPDACVDGIWEDILKKTIKYSRVLGPSQNIDLTLCCESTFLNEEVRPFRTQAAYWINEALSKSNKCPNPYTRLELFRLVRILCRFSIHVDLESLGKMFIHTISEIQPHCIHTSNDVNKVVFNVIDMEYIVIKCDQRGYLNDLFENTSFLLNCIQLIGVFADMTGSIKVPEGLLSYVNENYIVLNEVTDNYLTQIGACVSVLKSIGLMVSFHDLMPGGISSVNHLRLLPLFHPHVAETVCDVTSAIINNKVCKTDTMLNLIESRNGIAEELAVYTKTCDLPRLLMSRQIQGSSMIIRQHSLLLRNISPFSTHDSDGNLRGNENDGNDESDVDESDGDDSSDVDESDGDDSSFVDESDGDISSDGDDDSNHYFHL